MLGGVLAGCSGGGGRTILTPPSPTASLTAAPTAIAVGQSATLTWSSNPGTSCTASGGWSGTQPATGTAEVTPTATGAITYTLTCSGAAFTGSATQSVTLTVEAASAYTETTLVEDFAGGAARTTDARLLNPWGIASGPTSGIWVANNHSDTATIYDGNGRPSPIVVHFAPSAGGAAFDATGIVFNGTADFVVERRRPEPSGRLVHLRRRGRNDRRLVAHRGSARSAVTTFTAADGAVYKGLAIANNGIGNFLYAADFANGKIDVLDAAFAKQAATATSFAFTDPTLPAGYAPFGIQAIENGAGGATQIYVSYAKHDAAEPNDEAAGPGLGLVERVRHERQSAQAPGRRRRQAERAVGHGARACRLRHVEQRAARRQLRRRRDPRLRRVERPLSRRGRATAPARRLRSPASGASRSATTP